MKALVTGGGGFLGRRIVELLRSRGDEVRSFARGDYPDLRAIGVDTVRGDLSDRGAVDAACEGVDIVFHVAALPGIWGSKRRFHRTNVLGTRHVIDGSRRHGVQRLVYTSSPSVVFAAGRTMDFARLDESIPYPKRFGCVYSQTKAQAEREVLAANGVDGMRTTALRPHLLWGPRDNHLIPRLLDRARAGKLVRVGDGTNEVDLTYIDNAADAHLLAADHLFRDSAIGGQAYFISDGKPVKLWPWIDQLLRRCGLPPVRRAISRDAAYRLGAAFEVAYSLLRLPGEPRMTRFLAGQLAGDHHFDISRAARDFGYRPTIDNDTGLERLIDWLGDVAAPISSSTVDNSAGHLELP